MLLSYGANPNIRVYGEMGSNAILRPALAELLSSNDNVTLEVNTLVYCVILDILKFSNFNEFIGSETSFKTRCTRHHEDTI